MPLAYTLLPIFQSTYPHLARHWQATIVITHQPQNDESLDPAPAPSHGKRVRSLVCRLSGSHGHKLCVCVLAPIFSPSPT